ncbi:MAG: hypothetical protein JRI95_10075 [Deltaproteobacteria bacterium]|nr:hypothetical protein [Deltaproteobacteria bacterium]MBW2085832.1 hypothetical protein [Deltaproteobacteria bacterium]
MKHFIVMIALICLVVAAGLVARAGDEPAALKKNAAHLYPIAPGVWYPQDGPLPEKPMRYYRVRCWPGCHSGSVHGKYPDKPLNMKPIFPTSAASAHPAASRQK